MAFVFTWAGAFGVLAALSAVGLDGDTANRLEREVLGASGEAS